MGCIGIWCSSLKGPTIKNELEVHFNLWRARKKRWRTNRDFLDIGIMMPDSNTADLINIYVPALVDISNITDLGCFFRKDIALTAAVFNESWHPIPDGGKTIEVQDPSKKVLFSIYSLDTKTDIQMENKYNGTILRIQVPKSIKGKKHYYRIRLDEVCTHSIQRATKPFDSVLQSAFVQTDLVDFRLNDKRSLDSSLVENILADGDCVFSKVHFFLIREAKDDYVFSDRPPNKSRRLEGEAWKTYVGDSYLFDQVVAYNWKDLDKDSDFTVFAKFKSFKSNWITVIIFILVVLIFGFISSLIANFFFNVWIGG